MVTLTEDQGHEIREILEEYRHIINNRLYADYPTKEAREKREDEIFAYELLLMTQ